MENTDKPGNGKEGKSEQPGLQSNERAAGQGNSSDGLTRRLGADEELRGIKEQERLQQGEQNGEEERIREGSQGGSKGQKTGS